MRARPRPGTEVFGEAWERLFEPAVAHRGLWSPGGAPENSLAAFQAACAGGYGDRAGRPADRRQRRGGLP
jgi:hypothetical protein